MPETLKNIEDHIKNAQRKSTKGNQCTTAVTSPVANNYTQNVSEFLDSNPDLLEKVHSSRQTRSSAVVFSVKLSNLPEITEANLPEWKKMKKHRKYKCVICGKKKLLKEKYDDHMTMEHVLDIQTPSVSEYSIARNLWIVRREQSTPEELKTLTCDYDSDTGKRYSEDESESESYSDDTSETESSVEDTFDHSESQASTESPHFSTESHYSSDSEDDTEGLTDEKRKPRKCYLRTDMKKKEENLPTSWKIALTILKIPLNN